MIDKIIIPQKSFSQTRYNMYCYCERQYFLHYYKAYGAYEHDNSSELDFKIHLLKQIKSQDELIIYILNRAIKKLFWRASNIRKFRKIVRKESDFLMNNMLLLNFEEDHRYPILFDFYYRESSIKSIFDSFNERLNRIVEQLISDTTMRKFFDETIINLIEFPAGVSEINLGELTLYSNIVLGVRSDKAINFVSFNSLNNSYTTFFHKYYGFHKLKLPVEKIKSYLIDLGDEAKLIEVSDEDVEISQMIFEIGEKYAILPKYDKNTDYLNITGGLENRYCASCKFKELCL